MEQHTWWWYHTQGWWVWTAATVAFAALLVRTRRQNRPALVPWLLLGIWIVSVIAHYVRSDWHQYFAINRALWLGGLGSIAVVSALPLIACLLVDAFLARLRQPDVRRAVVSAAVGIILVFLAQTDLAHRTSLLVYRTVTRGAPISP